MSSPEHLLRISVGQSPTKDTGSVLSALLLGNMALSISQIKKQRGWAVVTLKGRELACLQDILDSISCITGLGK